MTETTTDCLVCERPATQADGLCADCARAGSELSGLWEATLWLGEDLATTPEQAVAVLAAVGWPTDCEEHEPAEGSWLLQLPPLLAKLALTLGHVCQSGGGARIEVDAP